MSDDDALGPDMHPLLGFLESAPPVAGQDPLDRLLDGRLDPAFAPAGYGELSRLLAAATAPATPEELAGEQAALAEFRAVMRPLTLIPRRASMPSKLLTVKAAAAALVAVLSIGGVAAAATGLLPGQARRVAEQAPSATAASVAARGLGTAAAVTDLDNATQGLCRAWQAGKGTDNGLRADAPAFQALAAAAGGSDNIAGYCADVTAGGASDHGQERASAVGPDATAAARAGLCRAWQAGKGTDNGLRTDSVAFQALAAAAGGADKVAGYCADVTARSTGDQGQGQGAPPSGSRPSTKISPPSSGPPPGAGPGDGHGQGGPPTTTGSP
jgi:hypothetical protein